jgi:hypothetical protein
MAQIIPIYIPTFISDQNYNPSRVLPHLYFYNGLIDCETYWIESGSAAFGGVTFQQNAFPYFDNYNVVSGSFPTTDSESLLFNNEAASYGEIPVESLYTNYWETYINLLYNPRTKLLTCEAIIPLADYFKMALNDVVNFKGNYYHLRAINDYSLKTGECTLQLLGPIIGDTLSDLQPTPIPPTGSTAPATASIKLAEYNASPTAFIDANLIVSGTSYFFSGDFTQSISGGTTANVTLEGKDGGSTVWGPYTTASATLTIRDNGTLVSSSTQFIYSGSGDTVITFPTTFTSGHNFQITGSTLPVTGSTPPPTGSTASLAWSFSETGGARGQMDLYVNGSIVESRSNNSNGTYLVYVGDTINVEVSCFDECGGNYSNAYCTGIINDADCQLAGTANIVTGVRTVVSGDIGTTLTLDNFAACSVGACV